MEAGRLWELEVGVLYFLVNGIFVYWPLVYIVLPMWRAVAVWEGGGKVSGIFVCDGD